ncbi:MAG: EAL and HDOD domain-containing protein [Aquificaceae bacterium]
MSFLIAKQPIFDKEGRKFAFEVFLRNKDSLYEYPKEVPYNRATYVIIEILLEQGIDKVSEGKRIMINVSLDSLINKALESFDPKKLVIEIIESQIPIGEVLYKQVMNAIDKYIQQGTIFSINKEYLKDEKLTKIFEKTQIISIDFNELDKDFVDRLRKTGKSILISKIENEKDYKKAQAYGDYFQGIYLEKPIVLKEFQSAPYLKSTLLKLMANIHRAESIKEIADVIATDVGMASKILRFVNSAYYSPVREIKDIYQACAMIGSRNLKNFLFTLAMNDYVSIENPALWKKSLIRALIAQGISEIIYPKYKVESYLMGLFSLIDRILNVDKIEFLKEIRIEPVVIDGYMGKNETLKMILDVSIILEEFISESSDAQTEAKENVMENLEKSLGIDKEILIQIAYDAYNKTNSLLNI